MSIHHAILERCRIAAFRDGTLKGLCFEPFASVALDAIPWDTVKHTPAPGYCLVKASQSRRVVTLEWPLELEAGERPTIRLYAKRTKTIRLGRRGASIFRRSKARREWELALAMLRLGIPTPAPALFADRRRFGALVECFIATVELENAASFREEFLRLETQLERVAALEALGRFIHEGHEKGFCHDDCSANHIFISGGLKAPGAGRRMAFIDLDNGRLCRSVSERRRVKNCFQIIRSLEPHTLTDEENRGFLSACLGRRLDDGEIARYLARISRLGEWKSFRKRVLKWLGL